MLGTTAGTGADVLAASTTDNEYAYFGINGAVVIVIGLVAAMLTPRSGA